MREPQPPPRPEGRRTIASSFACALSGLAAAAREPSMRFHLAAGTLVSCFVAVVPLLPAERALLLLCVALVVGAEAANSALEAAVDLASPGRSERARFAKDAAAAGVLVLAAGSVLAFAVVAGPSLSLSALGARRLEAAAALGAAAAAGLLPAPLAGGRAAPVLLAAGGAACLVPVARAASSPAGVVAAALLLAAALASAVRPLRA